MKFNEKLIALRKKEGLSQEELGYKLNVTRQTVSKWELGQTTPEMDKLAEMSKIFNISVDQLINDSETASDSNVDPINNKIEDQPIQEKNGKNNKISIILIIAFIVIAVFIIGKAIAGFLGFSIFKKAAGSILDMQGSLVNQALNTATGIYNSAIDKIEDDSDNVDMGNMLNQFTNNFNQITGIIGNDINTGLNDKINNQKNEVSVKSFNGPIELHSGSSIVLKVTTLLDTIITSNKTNDRIIAVEYNKIETQDEAEIRSIKQGIKKQFDSFDEFEIICEYDAQGYIYKVIIEKV